MDLLAVDIDHLEGNELVLNGFQLNVFNSDSSEELSNTATSTSSSSSSTHVDEESNSTNGFSQYQNGFNERKRPRKSAELANKRIKKESNSRFFQNDSIVVNDIPTLRSCENADCQLDSNCAIGISQNCCLSVDSKITYLHISKREHVCQHCYEEFRTGKTMFDRYMHWKRRWVKESRCLPNLRLFIFEELLPFWLNCSECGKFRRISRSVGSDLSPTIIAKFKCAYAFPEQFANPCLLTEEAEVQQIRCAPSAYIKSLEAPPLLQHSPAIHFLEDHYYYDEVGISPINCHYKPKDCSTPEFMCPFNIPNEQSRAFSLRPDVMEYDEISAFPEFTTEPMLYLAMRNLIVALWNLNPYEELEYAECFSHLICSGLARIWYSIELKRVIDYLTLKNVINYGILKMSGDSLLSRKRVQRLEVIVVGGGISGLGAARQLRAMGAKVALLEAKPKLGGRMQDDWSLGVAVGCGAQLVTGIVNNPIILMCKQIGLDYRLLSDECPLIDSQNGRLVTPVADRVVDEHFNCLLDIIGRWKDDVKTKDASLQSQLDELHPKLLKHMDFHWAKEYDRLFQWQIGNVEFSCGALLSDVSAKNWDQNECVGQFAGAHALLSHGSGELIKRLAEGLDVRCGHQVVQIDYSRSKKIAVKCENGKQFTCDKVLLCLPLTQYQREYITYKPEMPMRKRMAWNSLGPGLIEKVAVSFPRRFWSGLLKSADGSLDYFGHVPKSGEERGLFNMFYDFSARAKTASPKKQQFVLMSYVCGKSVELVNTKSDLEVVEEFVDCLRELFPDEQIPAPNGYVVTHWGRDVNIGMSYSYVRVGGSGDDYDELAKSVERRLYFAGECTNRFFPQTMTGAYVSGMRESSKMVEDWLEIH